MSGALLLVATLSPPTASAQEAVSLFNGRNLDGWQIENAKAGVRDGAIRVDNSSGWVRTGRPFGDFVLTLDVRMGDTGGKAVVFLRAWPTFDKSSKPNNAYRLNTTYPRSGPKSSGEASTTKPHEASTAPDWSHWEIECTGRSVRMRINGALVYTFDQIENTQGYVGLSASDGTAEFRNIAVRQIRPPDEEIPGVASPRAPGAVVPRLLTEVKPRYTAEAMARRIQGTVWLNVIIEPDGSVGPVRVVLGLDPTYGLDREAIAAAQAWKFTPPTRDGAPVRMLITIELAFTLK
jgi:TonB family protein